MNDEIIAREGRNALAWSRFEPLHHVTLSVSDGHVTLAGDVRYAFYRSIAESAVLYKPGVKAVSNRIRVT